MSVAQRIESLKSRHAERDVALRHEEGRPSPDRGRVFRLKKDKLMLKDEILRLTRAIEQGGGG